MPAGNAEATTDAQQTSTEKTENLSTRTTEDMNHSPTGLPICYLYGRLNEWVIRRVTEEAGTICVEDRMSA